MTFRTGHYYLRLSGVALKSALAAVLVAGSVGFTCAFAGVTAIPSTPPTQRWATLYGTMGMQMAASGHLIAADDFLTRALLFNPEKASWHGIHGMVLQGLDKDDAAINAFTSAIELLPEESPRRAEGYYKLGLLHGKQGNMDTAIKWVNKAIALAPENPMLHYDAGVFYASQNDYKSAAKATKKATELDPEFSEAWNNHAYALANLGQYKEALLAVEQSLNQLPDNAAALDTKGFALQGLKRYDEALEVYAKALALNANIGEIHLHQAQTLEAMNRPKAALKAYERFVILTPSAPEVPDVAKKITSLRQQLGIFLPKGSADDDTTADAEHTNVETESGTNPEAKTSFLDEDDFSPVVVSPRLKVLFSKQWHGIPLPSLGLPRQPRY